MNDNTGTDAGGEQGSSTSNAKAPKQAHRMSVENRAKQRQAFDAANKTHWLFASMRTTDNPRIAHPDSDRTDVHHPTIAETSGMIGVLATMMLYTSYQLNSHDSPIEDYPLVWALSLAPFALGIALALYARRWAKHKDNAAEGPPQLIDAPAPNDPAQHPTMTDDSPPDSANS